MTKRGQAVEEKIGLIAQVQEEYEEIIEEVQGYCQKAQELRKQADELRRSRSTDPQMATQIRQLLEQADYFDQLADQKDGHPRLEALCRIDDLQREAFAVKATISHNESVHIRQRNYGKGRKEVSEIILR
jgi:uncharacterized coiled-coil DUF342 family protein